MLSLLNPKESNGPLIDNKIFTGFNGLNGLNFRCAQSAINIWMMYLSHIHKSQTSEELQRKITVLKCGHSTERGNYSTVRPGAQTDGCFGGGRGGWVES